MSHSAAEAYYLPLGQHTFDPTEATTSPWNSTAQHGGPPSALFAHVMSELADPGQRLGRLSVDFPGPVPRKPLRITAEVTRPGRRVCRTEAQMIIDDRVVASASAWHIATGPTPPALGVHDFLPPPLPGEQPQVYFEGMPDWGHGKSVEWRFTHGSYTEPGPAGVWTRLRQPLVAGRELSGLERAIVVGESTNGLSRELPLDGWLFIPPTVTFTLLRPPVGEWVYADTRTTMSNDGIGLGSALIGDADGLCATVAQPLLVTAL